MEGLVLEKFCYCIEMRKGCIIMGILGVIGRTWAGVGNGIGWIYIVPNGSLHPWRAVVSILNGFVGIIAGIFLICGTTKDCKKLIQMYIMMVSFLILLLFASASLGIYSINSPEWKDHYTANTCHLNDKSCRKIIIWTIYTLVLDIIDVFAYIYFFICVHSYLQRLKQTNVSAKKQQCPIEEHLMT